jgi:hypothetical protein
VKPGQGWQTVVVSCFRVGCPVPGSAAPASRCAHTEIATGPAMIVEHPGKTDTAPLQ